MDQTSLFPSAGVFHQVSGIAGRVPCVGNQEVAVVYHVAVGPDNGNSLWDGFRAGRIEGAVKALRGRNRAVRRMIWQQERERHLRVALFGNLDRLGRKPVKAAIVTYKESRYTIVNNVAFHRLVSRGRIESEVSRCPMKKQVLPILTPPFFSYPAIALLYHCIVINGI